MRYLIFTGCTVYPLGGARDVSFVTDSLDELDGLVKVAVDDRSTKMGWVEVLDTLTGACKRKYHNEHQWTFDLLDAWPNIGQPTEPDKAFGWTPPKTEPEPEPKPEPKPEPTPASKQGLAHFIGVRTRKAATILSDCLERLALADSQTSDADLFYAAIKRAVYERDLDSVYRLTQEATRLLGTNIDALQGID